MIKITPKILSIPPHLSTSWAHVRNLHLKDNNMMVSLSDGTIIAIPNLSQEEVELIFKAHAQYLEGTSSKTAPPQERQPHQVQMPPLIMGSTADGDSIAALRFSFDNMESLGSAFHHNPEQAHLPHLPPDILGKIAAIAKIVAPEDIQNMPKPEPHCNCPHCQIVRAIHGKVEEEKESPPEFVEEEIKEEDLTFQQWEITQAGDKLYTVTNKLDTHEKYNVFLGKPIGCTCGHPGCEHILAVLKS